MTRVAALYDIHGNLPALEAVLADVGAAGVDEIIVGGDVVPGPMPRETLAALRELDVPVRHVMGNGDREVLASRRGVESTAVPEAFREAMRWNARQLRDEDEQRLASWPATLTVSIPGIGDVLFCHATPRNDTDIFTRDTPEAPLLKLFAGVDASIVVCGHTHMPFDRVVGATRVVNAGSVGMPYEREPGAYWLRLGPGVELRRTAFDTAAATEAFRALGYPDADGMTAAVDPDEVAARFEAAADAPLPPESLTGHRRRAG